MRTEVDSQFRDIRVFECTAPVHDCRRGVHGAIYAPGSDADASAHMNRAMRIALPGRRSTRTAALGFILSKMPLPRAPGDPGTSALRPGPPRQSLIDEPYWRS